VIEGQIGVVFAKRGSILGREVAHSVAEVEVGLRLVGRFNSVVHLEQVQGVYGKMGHEVGNDLP